MIICLTSCAGTGDWTYRLPNDYEVRHIHSEKVLIEYADLSSDGEGIPSFIKEFSYDERYVFTKNVKDITNNNIFDELYYALDTQEKKTYGPFNSVEELKNKIEEWNVTLPEKWYRTSPDPNCVGIQAN